jgi:acetoin utilization protein AcuB
MSKAIPEIKKFMTYNPKTIEPSKTISEAQSVMKTENIRHLPVVDEGKIVGIISDRDVKLLLGLVLSTPQSIKVRDILHSTVFSVHPDAPIDQVVDEMASKHYGCALVEDNGKLVGIFTTIDALKAVSDICHQRYHGG